MKYHNVENGTEYTQKFADNADGALLFELIFQNEEQKGMYQLDKLTYKIGEQTYTELFAEAGIEASFGVETDVETDQMHMWKIIQMRIQIRILML